LSDSIQNTYNMYAGLNENNVATAAAVELIKSACSAGDGTSKVNLLEWAANGDNIKNLRDRIKESAQD